MAAWSSSKARSAAPDRDQRDQARACHRLPDAARASCRGTSVPLRFQDLRRAGGSWDHAAVSLLTEALLRFRRRGAAAVLSLMNVALAIVPLPASCSDDVLVRLARLHRAAEPEPVGRNALFAGLYGGLAVPLAGGFLLGVGVPFLWGGAGSGERVGAGPLGDAARCRRAAHPGVHRACDAGVASLRRTVPRSGPAILLWLGATALYDALLVLVCRRFSDYPLEWPLSASLPTRWTWGGCCCCSSSIPRP